MERFKNQVVELAKSIRACAAELGNMAMDKTIGADAINAKKDELKALQDRHAAAQAAYDAAVTEQSKGLKSETEAENERCLKDMLGSREYVNAFAFAIRNGMAPGKGEFDSRVKPLYDALTIAGGSPAGTDGGFLVPEDINTTIREKRRELKPLADLFANENVNTNTGWRVTDTAPTTGFTALPSEIPTSGIAMDDQPAFAKVPYSLTTYGLLIPVSKELANDETANLMAYLGAWFAKKQVITENSLLINALKQLSSASVSSNHLAAITTALNVELDPAIASMATIVTNQNGFNLLDQLVDGNNRPLLQPDPTSPANHMIKGHRVRVVSNAQLPDVSSASPMFIGDFAEYATLFVRQPLEIMSTDVGGSAFRTNSIEVRGITRMDCRVFDSAAAVYKTLA